MLRRIFSLSNGALLVALALSTIAAWYSIIGLTAIFAGAVVPIIIMGSALELAKITTTVWLRKYWNRCGLLFKIYLVPAVIALALLTSMGIFGFLSKAHLDQNIGSGDIQAKVSLLDEKILTQRENIKSSKSMLAQMDTQVNDIMTKGDSERAVERSVMIRKQQAKERASLLKDIEVANKEIQKLNEERAPIASEMRKVEAEVGPIKYIAALIYGDNPDANVLERAVRWVIILLVVVFDPLAIMLVLAANQSKDWDDEEGDNILPPAIEVIDIPVTEEVTPILVDPEPEKQDVTQLEVTDEEEEAFKDLEPKYDADDGALSDEQIAQIKEIAWGTEPRDIISETVVPKFDIDAMTVDSMIAVNDTPGTVHDMERPGDYVVAPIIEELEEEVASDTTPNFEGFKDSATGEWVQTGPAFHVVAANAEINTDNVTTQPYRKLDNSDYVEFEGKRMHERVLKASRPDLFGLQIDEPKSPKVSFGTVFPTSAFAGDVFTRVDTIPNRVFKFNSAKWIEIKRETTDTYLTSAEYIQHLIEKLSTGEYDPDNLTAMESDAIAEFIKAPKI